ncbi:hypothetical protein B0H19DRAFT_1270234 [Mycena capillaripes]|nr:hypothetical protein B0H19DRAFT_1270234 [Mycena capillaripes]
MHIGVFPDDLNAPRVLEMLSHHASRWRDVYFWSELSSRRASKYLSSVAGKLQELTRLDIAADWPAVDVFKVAPRLKEIVFCGAATDIPNLPWAQIQICQYTGEADMNPADGLSLLRLAENINTFHFNVDLSDVTPDTIWPSVSSHAKTVTFNVAASNLRPLAKVGFGQIFKSLTLLLAPRAFLNIRPPFFIAQPSHPPRSPRNHNHRTRIIVLPLLLPFLEELLLSEDPLHTQHVFITDTLLRALTYKPDDDSLVPRLAFLCLTSFLRFSDDVVYWDLISSRIIRDDGQIFEIILSSLLG